MEAVRRSPALKSLLSLLAALLLLLAQPLPASPLATPYWDRVSIDGGSELLTLFVPLPARHVPLLSVLRDTLGDDNPENDQLRYVWLLGGQRQNRLIRWLTPELRLGDVPTPVLDLQAPAQNLWKSILRVALQSLLLDSTAALRVSSRSYLSNEAASQTVRLFEAVNVMTRLEDTGATGPLSPDEHSEILARLLLADRAFGGLVRHSVLDKVLRRELRSRRQALARNWELLRQRAEAEGLYFQPIAAGPEQQPVAALLWICDADLRRLEPARPFRSRFLNIANPWTDASLRQWNGYSEQWLFDQQGRRVASADSALRSERMIPLALYSLDHPKAPLLLVDFRSPWKPAVREGARRTIEEVPATVLGVAAVTHWEISLARCTWNFIRSRRGSPTHRPSRLRATAAVRQIIPQATTALHPELRAELADRLGVPPKPSSFKRYEALLAAAESPNGVARKIEKDRGRELAKLLHPRRSRWLQLATAASLGLYRYRVPPTPEHLALLSDDRRLARAVRKVEAALASGPRLASAGDIDHVRRAVQELATIHSLKPATQQRANRLLGRLVAHEFDPSQRRLMVALLDSLDNPAQHLRPATDFNSLGGHD